MRDLWRRYQRALQMLDPYEAREIKAVIYDRLGPEYYPWNWTQEKQDHDFNLLHQLAYPDPETRPKLLTIEDATTDDAPGAVHGPAD